MKRVRRRESRAEQLWDAVVDAAPSARAVATGAGLYTVVRAAFLGGRFVGAQRALKQHATDQPEEHAGAPDPRGQDIGAVASSSPTRPRPKRTPTQETGPQPSLRLPNRRWSRMAAERK